MFDLYVNKTSQSCPKKENGHKPKKMIIQKLSHRFLFNVRKSSTFLATTRSLPLISLNLVRDEDENRQTSKNCQLNLAITYDNSFVSKKVETEYSFFQHCYPTLPQTLKLLPTNPKTAPVAVS